MVSPPLEVGYWVGWFAGFCFVLVLAFGWREWRSETNHYKSDKASVMEMTGPITTTPSIILNNSTNFINKTTHAFTISPSHYSKMSEKEKSLVNLLLSPTHGDMEQGYGIPVGSRSLSFIWDGFEFGESCNEVKSNGSGRFEYQKKCSRVEMIYFVEGEERRPAAVTWYFESDPSESLQEKQNNLIVIYEIMMKKRSDEVKNLRRKEKEEAKHRVDPFSEYTSTAYSHMKLVMGNDGRILVLACNADGKNEKYAFNMKEKKYDLVEVANEDDVGGRSSYLVKAY